MLPRGKYFMPLLKFVEKLDNGQSINFGNFYVTKECDYKVCMDPYALVNVENFQYKLNDEGILEDGIVTVDMSELIFDFREYSNGFDYHKVRRILDTITENKMNFEILDIANKTVAEYYREFKDNDGFQLYWTDGDENYYEELELELVLAHAMIPERLRVLGDGELIKEFLYDPCDVHSSDSDKECYKIYVANIATSES